MKEHPVVTHFYSPRRHEEHEEHEEKHKLRVFVVNNRTEYAWYILYRTSPNMSFNRVSMTLESVYDSGRFF